MFACPRVHLIFKIPSKILGLAYYSQGQVARRSQSQIESRYVGQLPQTVFERVNSLGQWSMVHFCFIYFILEATYLKEDEY